MGDFIRRYKAMEARTRSITEYGAFIRMLRIKNNETMRDTAQLLGTSTSFVSEVEIGKKNVPNSWVSKLISHYHLDETETNNLLESIKASVKMVRISLIGAGEMQRRAATRLAYSFSELDTETARKICELLEGRTGPGTRKKEEIEHEHQMQQD